MRQVTSRVPGEWRLFLPALLVWAAAAVLIHYPGGARWVAGGAIIAGATIIVLVLRRASALASLLIVCAVLALLAARLEHGEQSRQHVALTRLASTKRVAEMRVRIASYPAPLAAPDERPGGVGKEREWGSRAGAWVRAEAEAIAHGGAPAGEADSQPLAARVPVLLWLPEKDNPALFPGARAQLAGTLSRAPPADSAAFLIQVHRLAALPPAASAQWTDHLAHALGNSAAKLRLGLAAAAVRVPGAALVPGFAVGDTSLVGSELDALMKESSLTHLTAVSGANCALVIAAAMWLAARLGAGRRLRLIVAAVGLGGFVVVVGPDASVQRAAIMGGLLLMSNFGGRRGRALPALGVAIIALLLADPWQAAQPGFALSVAATTGILLAAPRSEAWLRRRLRIRRVLALPLAVTIVAQVACAPLLLLLQPGIPVGGVLANLLAAPVAPAGTALGLLALVALPAWEPLGYWVIWVAAWPARWIEAAGAVSAGLPAARWHWPGGATGALLLVGVYGLALVALGLLRVEIVPWRRRGRGSLSPGMPRLVRVCAGAAAGVVFAVSFIVPVAVRWGVPDDWVMVACDVGQGDATLVRDPRRPDYVMLIDTGEEPEKLERCLDLFRVKEVALLAITHNHQDHVGAVDVVAGMTGAGLAGPESEESKHNGIPAVAEVLREAGIPTRLGGVGLTSEALEETAPPRHRLAAARAS